MSRIRSNGFFYFPRNFSRLQIQIKVLKKKEKKKENSKNFLISPISFGTRD